MDSVNLAGLPGGHRRRLEWFETNRGREAAFPDEAADGPLATRAKGIYKPAGLPHALSIRVMLSSPYADKSVEQHSDGSWSLQYFQENPDPRHKLKEYTNRALDRCQQDGVPVGVLVQTSVKPVSYLVLGLAHVTGWEAGLFRLESATLSKHGLGTTDGDASESGSA